MAPSVTRRLISRLRGSDSNAAAAPATRQPHVELSARPAVDSEAPSAAHTVVHTAALESLTEREREVFDLIAEGMSNAEIGERLFLSESTVKTHVGRVLTKLQLRDRVHAVIFAYENGAR